MFGRRRKVWTLYCIIKLYYTTDYIVCVSVCLYDYVSKTTAVMHEASWASVIFRAQISDCAIMLQAWSCKTGCQGSICGNSTEVPSFEFHGSDWKLTFIFITGDIRISRKVDLNFKVELQIQTRGIG
jgi:hypothetical protein